MGRNNLIYCAERNDSVENKVTQTLLAVAHIIKDEIRSIKFNNNVSPILDDISWSKKSRQWITEILCVFLWVLVPAKFKAISTDQSIVQASKN